MGQAPAFFGKPRDLEGWRGFRIFGGRD